MSSGFFTRLGRVGALLADPRAPKLPKLALVAALLYAISPIDLVPEAILPVVGWLDDLLIGLAALRFLLKQDGSASGPDAVAERGHPPETPAR